MLSHTNLSLTVGQTVRLSASLTPDNATNKSVTWTSDTPAGVSVTSFRIAVERNYADKDGKRKADFFDVVAWRGTAEFICRYFGKGSLVLVEGQLQSRTYQTKNGDNRTVVEIVAENELGHIFWTDFDDNRQYMAALQSGQFYPYEPKHVNKQQFADALAKKEYRSMLCKLCHQIGNVLEDIYVNALQRQMLGGLYAQGINLGNQLIAEDAISIEEQKKKNYFDFTIVINCLLTQLKANAVYYGEYETEYKPRVRAVYRIARQHILSSLTRKQKSCKNLLTAICAWRSL